MTPSSPLVSVIMPVYNAERYLSDTIQSILSQSLTDFEFIIVNDASTDRSKEIILSFTDPRIRYFENDRNQGYIYSLNHALQLVKGAFIARMDADDLSLPNRLREQYDFLQHEPDIDLVGAAIRIEREGIPGLHEMWDYPTSPGAVKARLLFNTAHAHPVVFFRRSLVDRKLYEYEPDYYPAEDYRLWVKLNQFVNTSNLKTPQLIYRVSATQTSSISHQKQKHNGSRIRASYFNSLLAGESVSEDTVYAFWDSGFKIDSGNAAELFHGFESIYQRSHDDHFRRELAVQMRRMMSMIYQVHPEFVTYYRRSAFNSAKPLSLKDQARFALYPLWKQFK